VYLCVSQRHVIRHATQGYAYAYVYIWVWLCIVCGHGCVCHVGVVVYAIRMWLCALWRGSHVYHGPCEGGHIHCVGMVVYTVRVWLCAL